MPTTAKFTIEQYHQLVNTGLLCDRNIELIEGELIELSHIN